MTEAGNGHPREKLSEYLDDALDLEARELVDRHLADCEDCRAELESLQLLATLVRAESVPPVPSELATRIGRRLDKATVVRPQFRRLVVPASIAATIGAVGLLVALQWREGRFAPTEVSQSADKLMEYDERNNAKAPLPSTPAEEKHAAQPTPAPAREQEPPAALHKDQKQDGEPVREGAFRQKKAEAAPRDVEPGSGAGVVGGVLGGVQGGVEGETAEGVAGGVAGGGARDESGASESDAKQRAAVDDARRDAPRSRDQKEAAAGKPKSQGSFAPAPATAPPAAMARSAREASCTDRWSDSGVRGEWGVPDVDAAARQLGRIANAVGGTASWRGAADGRPYVLVVPRGHFEEVFYALRARGVAGLKEAPTLTEGTDCIGLSVALTLVPEH